MELCTIIDTVPAVPSGLKRKSEHKTNLLDTLEDQSKFPVLWVCRKTHEQPGWSQVCMYIHIVGLPRTLDGL